MPETTSLARCETIAPSAGDSLLARESGQLLATQMEALCQDQSVRIQVVAGQGDLASVALPTSALRALVRVLTEMSHGHAVTLVPTNLELTTQQAADLLCVSRPFLVKLLDQKKIPFRKVGKYRRVRTDDLMAYKRRDDEFRSQIADALTADAQMLEMGY